AAFRGLGSGHPPLFRLSQRHSFACGERPMLQVLGTPSRPCDGISRRRLLSVGALALGGRLLPALAAESPRPPGVARSVLLIDLFGGPSHIDTFDLKPAAPKEIRGDFNPIATSLPGLRICEHLPRLAK